MGGLVEVQLFGQEKTWWATNHKHDPTRFGIYRNQVGGGDRREQANILIDQKIQIPVQAIQLVSGTRKIEVPFNFPLPHTLPSSFIYAGDMLSVFRV